MLEGPGCGRLAKKRPVPSGCNHYNDPSEKYSRTDDRIRQQSATQVMLKAASAYYVTLTGKPLLINENMDTVELPPDTTLTKLEDFGFSLTKRTGERH
ncbi:hypothetical protein EG68_02107 [Paragonimus skrjabini miyazakii]|uniref:Uncharacterized protein n=1 Tax=Paragonimus skrjabini miyazakii TaxID=59628 RepID=A0A8S9Z447_9TREM|nr:hypothetical protein EG68_02107 [Paragonimus skrjabini miyazakii]